MLLGVLGGLGPMSTFYFCELLTSHTKAASDADHIDKNISSRASTPDRTAFILGRSLEDPLPVMLEEAERLTEAGADLLVIPCNTAHYFYDGLAQRCRVPILNIIRETVHYLRLIGVRHIGLLATEGTVASGAYHRLCEAEGIECTAPDREQQAVITSVIYGAVKQNKPVDHNAFRLVTDALTEAGCEKLVLGCTELSLLLPSLAEPERYVDSLEVLACRTILACGRNPVGFCNGFELLREVAR